MLFVCAAESFRFWEAWLFLGLMGMSWTLFFFSFLKRDAQLLARRFAARRDRACAEAFSEVLYSNLACRICFDRIRLSFRMLNVRGSSHPHLDSAVRHSWCLLPRVLGDEDEHIRWQHYSGGAYIEHNTSLNESR
jgi:hypothetical protein